MPAPACPTEEYLQERFITFNNLCLRWVGPGVAKRTLGGVRLRLSFTGGWRIRFVQFPKSPTPNPSDDGSLGPEVPRTLPKRTTHAKVKFKTTEKRLDSS